MLQPNMLKKLNENAMKMAESGSSKEDIIAMKDAFIEKFGTQDTVKKKDESVSTSQKENGGLAPRNGSLVTKESNGMATLKKGYDLNISSNEPKYSEKKPVKTLQLKNKLLNTKVTPENMGEINAATNEISALQKKQTQNAIAIKKQEDLQKDPNFLSKYQDFMSKTSTVTDDDVLRAKDELNSEIDNNEWTDVLREGAKKAVNNVVDFANTPMKFINSLGGDLPTIPLIEAKKPLEKNLKQADEYFLRLKKDAIKNNKSIPKVTQEDRLEKAKEFFIKEKTDSYLASRQKDYLQEQDDIDGGVLQSKFADFEKGKLASIDEKEKILLNKQAVQEVTHTRLQTEIENLQEQAKKTGVTDELKQSFNEKVSQLKQVELEGLQTINEYVNNRNNVGNVTDNLDIFKRNYSLWGNLTGNIAVASTDLISGAFGALDYGAKAISKATGLKSGGLFEDASKDTKMLSEKIASEIEKPISVENINSLSDFGDWLMNDVGAKQIPILALISTGTAGIAGIGATALGSKFEDMRGEVQRGEKKYSTTEMLLHPLGYGLAETASAAVDLMVLKNAGRVISSATDLERREIAKGMWNRAKNYLGASIEGGVTETLDETGTKGIQNIIDGKPFTEGMLDAGAAGGAMGFIIPFIAANYKQTIKPFTTDNKIQEASAKALKLQAQLDNPKLDSDTKLIIQENLDKAKTEVESLIKKSVKDISVLSNDQFKEIVSMEKTQAEIKSKAEKIKFDDNLEDDLKNQIIANLKTEFDTTEQRRIDLLQRGASAEIGRLAPEEQIRLKDLAQRKLMKELNPDGTKNISLNDEQISKEAVAIFKEEKVVNNENNPKFVSDEQQTKISNSGTPEELGSGNEIYSREQEALNRLGERTRADEEKLQRPLTRFEIEDLQKEEALKFAKEKDLWVKDFYSLGTPTNIGGNENTIVYNKEEQTLYKSNNLSNHQNTLSSFFEGLEGHNSIFPETQYELVGFTGIDKGKDKTPYIEPILKQDFVLNADQATQEDIDNHMASIGFEKVNDHTFKNEQYTVSDLRPRNVLKDADGTIYVIDDIVKKNKPNEAEASQNIPDKSNIQTKTITSSKVKNPKTGESTAFDVDIENGIVTGIRNSKTGKPIEEFVEATYKSKDKKTGKIITKTKLRKNGNWASIESEALGLETENEVNKKNKEILTNFTPSNEYEAALHALATGSKISYESLSSEAGNTDSKWATNQSAKETLPTVEKLSEQIWQDSETELDQQEIRNQLIDIINSFGSTKEVQQAVINIGNENTIKLQEEEMRVFLGSLSEKEFAQYQSIKAEDDYISELTDEEAIAYFEKEYESKTEEYYEKRGQSKTNEPSGTIESNSVQERSGEKETTRGKERQGEEIDNSDLEDDTEIVSQGFFNGNKQNQRDLLLSNNGPVKFRHPFQKYFKKLHNNTFKSNSGLDDSTGEVIRSRNRTLSAFTDHLNQEVNTFSKIIKSVKNQFPKDINNKLLLINDYLSGDKGVDIDFLTSDQKNQLDYFRNRIDGLSKSILDLLEAKKSETKNKESIKSIEKTIETIKNNMGIYITRNYQIFSDDNYRDMITGNFNDINRDGQLRIRNAINYLIKEDSMDKNKATEAIAEYLSDIRRTKNDFQITSNGKAVSNFLKKRKNIPLEFRELLGESKDPLYNYTNTVYKISQYLANIEYQSKLRHELINNKIAATKTKLGYVRLVEEGEGWNILNDIYVPIEFKEAYDDMQPLKSIESSFYKNWIKIAGYVKLNKTILSPTTTARNLVSGIFLGANSGHLFLLKPDKIAESWNQAWATSKTEKQLLEERQKLIKYGVLGDGANSGEMMAVLNDFSKEVDRMIRKNTANKVFDFAKKLYAFGDDFYKVSGFYIETSSLVKSGMELKDAEKLAAYRINNGYPTYSYLPRNIQRLRRIPLVGSFVSFPYEAVRTTKNNLLFIKEDLKAGRTKMAMTRGAGMIVANAMLSGLSSLTMALLGISDDDDDAIRDMLPEWQKNSKLIYLGTKNGKPVFIDGTSFFASETLIKPLSILFENRAGRDIDDKIKESLNEILSPYISKDISFKTLMEISENEDQFNQKIYLSNNLLDGILNESDKIINYLMKQAGPGIYNNATEFLRANEISPEYVGDKFSSYGKEYTNQEALLGILGARLSTINYNAAMSSFAYQIKDTESADKSSASKLVKTSQLLDTSQVQKIVVDYAKYHEENYNRMLNIVNAGKKMGMSNNDIFNSLKLSNMPKRAINDLLQNKIPDLTTLSQQSTAKFKEKLKINYKGEKNIYKIINNFNKNKKIFDEEINKYNKLQKEKATSN